MHVGPRPVRRIFDSRLSQPRQAAHIAVGALSVLLASCTTAPTSAPFNEGPTDRLEGTWVVSIVPPTMANVPAHNGFISFVRGGVVLGGPEPNLPPFVAPIVRTANLQGTWGRAGSQEFVWTLSSLGYDAKGAPAGILKLSGRLRLTNKDTFEGSAWIAACDLDLACRPFGASPARNLGTRLKVEPVSMP